MNIGRIISVCVIIFISLMSSGLAARASSNQTGDGKCIIGYGYSDLLLPCERQEYFYIGFEYGLKYGLDHLKKGSGPCASYGNIEIKRVIKTGKKKLDALRAAKELVSDGAILLTGFPTSHEAVLAAQIAKAHETGLIVPGAGASALMSSSDYIFTTSPTNMSYVEEQLNEFIKHYKGKNILVVAKRDAVFSTDILKRFREFNTSTGNQINILSLFLNDGLLLDEDDLKEVLKKGIASVFIATYASESKLAMSQILDSIPTNMTVYVSAAWPIGDSSYLSDVRSQYDNRVVSLANWAASMGRNSGNEFAVNYKKQFGSYPNVEVAHGYESGMFAAYVLAGTKARDAASVLNSLRSTTCVPVGTVGEICRDSNGFAKRKFFWLEWTLNGFEPVAIR